MLKLFFWKNHDIAHLFKFESEIEALDFVRRVVADPNRYNYDFDGWSLTDETWCWIYKEGEKIIPVKAA